MTIVSSEGPLARGAKAARPAREPARAFHSRFPVWLLGSLKVEAKRKGLSVNAYLTERLRAQLDPLNADRREAVLAKRLGAMDEQLAQLAWSQRVILESVGALAHVVLGCLPEATTKDERRQAKFARRVAEHAGGRTKGFCAALNEELERNATPRETPPWAETPREIAG